MRRSRAPWRTEAWIVEAMMVGGWEVGACKREDDAGFQGVWCMVVMGGDGWPKGSRGQAS